MFLRGNDHVQIVRATGVDFHERYNSRPPVETCDPARVAGGVDGRGFRRSGGSFGEIDKIRHAWPRLATIMIILL